MAILIFTPLFLIPSCISFAVVFDGFLIIRMFLKSWQQQFVQAAPAPRPFNPDDFLSTLGTSGPQLTSGIKGDWVGLYRRFFRSPNFSGWFNARYREVSQKLQALQLEALSDAVSETSPRMPCGMCHFIVIAVLAQSQCLLSTDPEKVGFIPLILLFPAVYFVLSCLLLPNTKSKSFLKFFIINTF